MSNVKKLSGMMMKRFNKITPETMRARIVYRQSTDHS